VTAIIVTRPQGAADPLAGDLTGHGYRVHAVPTVATEAMPVTAADLKGFDWIIVTSAAGVTALPFLPRSARWAAVGTATAAALEAHGITAELVPEPANGEGLAKALPDAAGRRVLLARADTAAAERAVKPLGQARSHCWLWYFTNRVSSRMSSVRSAFDSGASTAS